MIYFQRILTILLTVLIYNLLSSYSVYAYYYPVYYPIYYNASGGGGDMPPQVFCYFGGTICGIAGLATTMYGIKLIRNSFKRSQKTDTMPNQQEEQEIQKITDDKKRERRFGTQDLLAGICMSVISCLCFYVALYENL